MKPTSAHNTARADDARMIDDDAKEQTEEGQSAPQAALRAPLHAAPSAEHKHSDSSSSSMDETRQPEAAAADSTPAPSARRSKRVRELQLQADASAATAVDPLAAAAPAAAASSSSRASKQARTAATSSVQLQKSASASANKNGSGSRGSRAEPEQDEAAPEAAAVAAASSASKRKPAAAASSKPAASSKATVASAASARPSPFSRLDADSLGVALSCLDANEFLVARLVSKQWHAASAKRTAWPQLQVDDFIRLMQTDSYDDPSKRRLVVNTDDKLRSFAERFSSHASKDVFGKHASEVKLEIKSARSTAKLASQQILLRSVFSILSSQFQFLSALTLDGCDLENEPIQQLFTALGPRLRVLILSSCGLVPYREVSLLTQLRVLVMDALPPAEALRSLVSLQYLHVTIPSHHWPPKSLFTFNHGRVLRWLSVNHALRSLSMETEGPHPRIEELVASTEAEATATYSWQPALPAPIVLDPPLDFTVPARFTDLSVSGLAQSFLGRWTRLPDLRRLEFEHSLGWHSSLYSIQVSGVLPRLTELRVPFRFSVYYQTRSVRRPWQELRACSSLCLLTFTTDLIDEERTGKRADPVSLPPLLSALSATIEEIRLGVEVLIAFQADGENEESIPVELGAWSSLAACKQLRMLEISFSDSMPDSFLRALSSLPLFRSLELSFRSDLPRIPPSMLERMLESSSWSALHLFSVGHPEPRRFDPLQPRSQTGLKAQLADLQQSSPHLLSSKLSNRIRLYVHLSTQSRVRTYRIAADEDTGTLTWESDQ